MGRPDDKIVKIYDSRMTAGFRSGGDGLSDGEVFLVLSRKIENLCENFR